MMGNPNMVPIYAVRYLLKEPVILWLCLNYTSEADVFEVLNRVVLSNCYQTGFLCIYSILSQVYVLCKEYDIICPEMPFSIQWYTANGEMAVNILISEFEGSEFYLFISVYQQ